MIVSSQNTFSSFWRRVLIVGRLFSYIAKQIFKIFYKDNLFLDFSL